MLFNPFLEIDYDCVRLNVVTIAYNYRDSLISLIHLFIKTFYVLPENRVYFVHEFQPIVDPGSIHYHRTINRILKYDKIGFDEAKVWMVILLIGTIPSVFIYHIVCNLHFCLALFAVTLLKKTYPPRGPIHYQRKKNIDASFLPKQIEPIYDPELLVNTYKQYLFSDPHIVRKMILRTPKKFDAEVIGVPKTVLELIKKPNDFLVYNCMGKLKYRLNTRELPHEFISPQPSSVIEGKRVAQAFYENYINSEKIPIYTATEYTDIVTSIDDYNLMVDIITLGMYIGAHILYFFL